MKKKPKKPKRSKQHIVTAVGCHVGVTFTPAEEVSVRRKADHLGISVDELIERSIDKYVRARAKTKRPVDELIGPAIKALAASSKRRSKR